jgi:hypothetical protein
VELTEQQQYNRFASALQHFAGYIASLNPDRRDTFVEALADGATIA